MKLLGIFACLIAMAALCVPAPASAGQIRPYQVKFHNESDAWAWVSPYGRFEFNIYAAIHAFCVAPHEYRNFVAEASAVPDDVRIEVEHRNCSHPVMLDTKMGWDGRTPYYLHGANGKYRTSHLP